jgi:hypothetical protein
MITSFGLFLGFAVGEPRGVIWSLAIYCVAGFIGLLLLARSTAGLFRTVRDAWTTGSLRPFAARQVWKPVTFFFGLLMLIVVSIASANYSINHGSHVNPVLFLTPLFAGCYMVSRRKTRKGQD